MISLTELDDCKTCEALIDLIHLDQCASDWDDDWGEDDDDDDETPFRRPPQTRADADTCSALIREALEYAALGDLAEAKLRVHNRFHPKFHSERACLAAYKEAMAERAAR